MKLGPNGFSCLPFSLKHLGQRLFSKHGKAWVGCLEKPNNRRVYSEFNQSQDIAQVNTLTFLQLLHICRCLFCQTSSACENICKVEQKTRRLTRRQSMVNGSSDSIWSGRYLALFKCPKCDVRSLGPTTRPLSC